MAQVHAISEQGLDPDVFLPNPQQEALVRQIRAAWSDTLDKNIEVAECLIALALPKRSWKLNLLNLPMSYSWARRLIKIGADHRIRANLVRMPDSRATLHEIALLTDREFNKALHQSIIHKTCMRQDIKDFRRREQGASAKVHLTLTLEATAKQDQEAIDELADARAHIEIMLKNLFPAVKIKKRNYIRPAKLW